MGTAPLPVEPISTATLLAGRSFFFDRAIDSSFSATVTSRGRWDAGVRGERPVLKLFRTRPWRAFPCDAPAASSPDYVPGGASDERVRNFCATLLRDRLATFRICRVSWANDGFPDLLSKK
ncbi:hypothetical protein Asi03nite_16950 [Actinoplanes siamensis]|uniref:Uncharacterized protein n=1 Tax=Actinoplanes siamensis TaxID=1223317 RepID=A0A919N4C5_9ACTN|nr:hypothetical protein Asi03nite_16950 [Actinoplanes siamensis]